MTLSLLMYALMIATAATLSSVLVVDAVRSLSRRHARRAVAAGRPVATDARTRRVAPTRS
ncbi:MAG: hypothetical protein ACRDLN_00355 [Solirubrobacteraceae bacterium]